MKSIKLFAALALVSTIAAAPALALGPVSISAKADYASKYVWRGYDVYANGDAFQPSVTASYAPIAPLTLSLGVWSSYDVDASKEWTEFDYTGAASYKINDLVTVSAGYIFYAFPQVAGSDENDTKEIFATAAFTLPMGFTAGLGGYYDHDDGKGYYLTGSLDYAHALGEKATVTAGASLGYMNYKDDTSLYFDEDGNGFSGVSDVNLRAGVSAPLTDALSVSVTAVYTIVPDDAINQDNEFWTLTSLAYNF